MKKVLILGVTGQDGSNMADYLLAKTTYRIFGGVRRLSVPNHDNIKDALKNPRFSLVSVDLTDTYSVNKVVQEIKPDYLINLAANSFVGSSWSMPLQVMDVNANGVIRCLEAVREHVPTCRFYSAGSSEEMGDVLYSPQDINHPIRPRSIYGVSKASARFATKVYRESYGLYAVHGILYNHEGIRRGEEFVTRKITMGVARIKMAIEASQDYKPIELGNLDARRDWSDSRDFVDGIWKMLNQEGDIKEYILASGEMHSIRKFVEEAFEVAGIDGLWRTTGPKQKNKNPLDQVFKIADNEAIVRADSTGILVKVNPQFYRPCEVEQLRGDSSPIRRDLRWEPKINFKQLVSDMVNNDLNLLRNRLNKHNE